MDFLIATGVIIVVSAIAVKVVNMIDAIILGYMHPEEMTAYLNDEWFPQDENTLVKFNKNLSIVQVKPTKKYEEKILAKFLMENNDE
ncbi:TMhelix containing protein [Vibrio phage 1.262.O._10N.286.51.A9]|nr:TMhelix containing protein [Vibrio phage 1.262.O._10N.286.51.A9]